MTSRRVVDFLAVKLQQDFTDFNKGCHLVRDQEAGGSNPLAPTILFLSFRLINMTANFYARLCIRHGTEKNCKNPGPSKHTKDRAPAKTKPVTRR